MTQTVYGTTVGILIDDGAKTFILNRDILDDTTSFMYGGGDELTDITNPVLSVSVTHGARVPAGILTDVEAGQAIISIYDDARDYDPANLARTTILNEGAGMAIEVGGFRVFTGYIDTVEHTLAGSVTTFTCQDAIPRLSQMDVAITLNAGTCIAQMQQVLDAIGWPADQFIVLGSPVASRAEDPIVMSAWAALNRIRDAELGDLWISHEGAIVFRARGDTTTVGEVSHLASIPDIGDAPGIPLADITTSLRRTTIVNHVAIDMTDPTPDREYFADTAGGRGRSSFTGTEDDLRLT